MTPVEKVARALCHLEGLDPDGQSIVMSGSDIQRIKEGEVVRPAWRDRESKAQEFVAMAQALNLIP